MQWVFGNGEFTHVIDKRGSKRNVAEDEDEVCDEGECEHVI